jgi:hypothetical protein
LLDAARRGELGRDDHVWQPGSDVWVRADDIVALWAEPLSRRKVPWMRAAVVGLVVSGAALLILLPSLISFEPDRPRPIRRNCAFNDYVQGRCR